MIEVIEEWKPIADYEGLYEISSLGNVRSLDRVMYNKRWNKDQLIKGKDLKPSLYKNGYLRIELTDMDGNRKKHPVHKLVALAFIPNPNNYPQVNHKDEDKTNNSVSNLEWCTAKYNINYGTWKDRHQKQIAQYNVNGTLVATYKSLTDAAKEGFTISQISKCCNGKLNTHKGFRWTFI